MVARRALPDADHVMRFAPLSRQLIDGDTGASIGIAPTAFAIRAADKGGLSVTWIEHFGKDGRNSRAAAAAAYRESLPSKKLPAKGAFAWAEIEAIKNAGVPYRKRIRVVHDPVEGNPGHAEVRHFDDDDLELLELLATDVFIDWEFVANMSVPDRKEKSPANRS